VRRYAREIEPGDRYERSRLYRLQAALQSTPYFSTVTVVLEPDRGQPTRAPIRVHVTEARTTRLSAGGGYSTNTGFRVQADASHADLFGRAWLLRSGIRLEQRNQAAYADVFLPPAERDYRWSFGALGETTDIQGLRTERGAIGAALGRVRERIEDRFTLTFQRERDTPSGGESIANTALVLNASRTWRRLDNVLDPRSGYLLNLQAGGAAKALLSDQDFVRLYGRTQVFLPVGSRDTVLARLEAGRVFADGIQGVPQEQLFRTGGSQSVRGYAYKSIGYRVDDAVVGGRHLLVGSVEYLHMLAEQWGVTAFYDIGAANDSWNALEFKAGYGVGALWKSPAGPLTADVAYGEADHRVRFHLSVAIAF
jgi:translocation and assembly module TamA